MSYSLYIHDGLEDVTAEELRQAIERLPGWRREQALRFRHEQGRKECALSYLLLCRALEEVYGIDVQPVFVYGKHGKPCIEQCCFNLSHCKHAVVCVVSGDEVGVDVERVGRLKDGLARRVLNDEEYARVMEADSPDLEFTKLWTQKEAIVKLTGRGIDDDLRNILLKYNNVSLCTEVFADKGYVVTVAEWGACG